MNGPHMGKGSTQNEPVPWGGLCGVMCECCCVCRGHGGKCVANLGGWGVGPNRGGGHKVKVCVSTAMLQVCGEVKGGPCRPSSKKQM